MDERAPTKTKCSQLHGSDLPPRLCHLFHIASGVLDWFVGSVINSKPSAQMCIVLIHIVALEVTEGVELAR